MLLLSWRPARDARRRGSVAWTLAALAGVLALASSADARQSPPDSQPPVSQPVPPLIGPPAPEDESDEPPTSQPSTQPAGTVETAASAVSIPTIQGRITQVEASKDLPEPAKVELLNTYRSAIDQLNLADTWTTRAAEFAKGRAEAPELLAAARQKLDAATTRPTTVQVEVPADATLDDLTARQAKAEAQLAERQEESRKLEEESKQRATRRLAIPDLIAEATRRLEQVNNDLATPTPTDISPELAQARRWQLLARRQALQNELKAYQQELQFYDARSDVLAARRDTARLALLRAQSRSAAWQGVVSARRQALAQEQQAQAEQELRNAPRPIRNLAETNAKLASEQTALAQQIAAAEKQITESKKLSQQLQDDLGYLQTNVEKQGMSALIGPLMRKKRAELPAESVLQRQYEDSKREFARAGLRAEQLEEQRQDLLEFDEVVHATLRDIQAESPNANLARLEPRARELLQNRLKLLSQVKRDYETYFNDQADLIAVQSTALSRLTQLRSFIEQHVLWISSTGPIWKPELPRHPLRLLGLFVPLGQVIARDALDRLPLYALVAAAFVILLALRRSMKAEIASLGDQVVRVSSDRLHLTPLALLLTVLLATTFPVLLWLVAWRLAAVVSLAEPAVADLGLSIARGFSGAAFVLLTLAMMRHICRVRGVGERHFDWDETALRRLRPLIIWLQFLVVPLVFLVAIAESLQEPGWRDTVGRLIYIFLNLLLAYVGHRLLHPARGILAAPLQRYPDSFAWQLRHVWYLLAVGAPLALIVAAAIGYYYTAIELSQKVGVTIWLLLGVLLLYSLAMRWVFYAQRKIAIEEARKRRAAQAAQAAQAATQPAPAGESVAVEEETFDLARVSEQTRKLLRSVTIFALVVALWLNWSQMLPSLAFLSQVTLWSEKTVTTGADGVKETVERAITLANALLAILTLLVTVVLARNIPGLLEISLLRNLPLDRGARFAITSISRYVIVTVGIVLTGGAMGIGWAQVQWLVAGISVGLGFGLQEIFANFVSGLMLLFERPIRVGDTVTVGEISGTVTRIRIRATTITGWDRKELVIPNKEFITGQVINWTLSDSVLRVIVPVGIAYGSDVALAREVLHRVARETPTIVADPAPRVLFVGFGDSSLNFEVRVYIDDIDQYLNTIDALHDAIDREFRRAGIEISFPQRDLHIRSISDVVLPIRRDAAVDGRPAIPPADPSDA